MASINQRVRSANRVVILLDGKPVGLMRSCQSSDDYGLEPASGIGDIHVQEHVPSVARHTLSCQAVMLNKASLLALGLAPENGEAALLGQVFDIAFYDKDTGEELRKYTGCSYASGQIEVSAHAMVMQSATFMALDVAGLGAAA